MPDSVDVVQAAFGYQETALYSAIKEQWAEVSGTQLSELLDNAKVNLNEMACGSSGSKIPWGSAMAGTDIAYQSTNCDVVCAGAGVGASASAGSCASVVALVLTLVLALVLVLALSLIHI